jgi:hypothetical protein
MRTVAIISLVSICLAITSPGYSAETNLIPNPGFEEKPQGWTFHKWEAKDVTGSWASDKVHGGKGSLKQTHQRDDQKSAWHYDLKNLRAGSKYLFCVRTMSQTDIRSCRLLIQFKGKDGAFVRKAVRKTAVNLAGVWEKLRIHTLVPEGTEVVRISLVHVRSKGSSWWDDLYIEEKEQHESSIDDRRVFKRGEEIPISILGDDIGKESTIKLSYKGRVLKEIDRGASALATALLASGKYRLVHYTSTPKMRPQQRKAVEFEIVPNKRPAFIYGNYKSFPPAFDEEDVSDILRELKSHHFNADASKAGWISAGLMDQMLKSGVWLVPAKTTWYFPPAGSIPKDQFLTDSDGKEATVGPRRLLCFNSRAAHELAVKRIQDEAQYLPLLEPILTGYAFYGDDVNMFRGGRIMPNFKARGALTCYNKACKDKFRAKTGLEAPIGNPDDHKKRQGILPDDDPWLLWMDFRCRDTFGGYHKFVRDTQHRLQTPVKCGPLPGAGGLWNPAIGLASSYHLKEANLLSYYRYPLTRPKQSSSPVVQLFNCRLAFLGGRNKDLIALPQGIERPDLMPGVLTPALIRQQYYSLLAGGAKGIVWFIYRPDFNGLASPQHSKVWAEVGRLGAKTKQYGKLFLKLKSSPQRIGLLVSYSTSIFQVWGDDLGKQQEHLRITRDTFFNLLRAQLPVEIIDEEDIAKGRLDKYDLVILAGVDLLRERIYKQIRKYAGKVLIDKQSRIKIAGATKLNFNLNSDYKYKADGYQATTYRQAVKRVKKTIYPLVKPIVVTDTDQLVVRQFADEFGVDYLWLTNFEKDIPLSAKVSLPKGDYYAYDVFAGKEVQKDLTVNLAEGGGKLLALYLQQIKQVELDLPKSVSLGKVLKATIKIVDKDGKPVKGRQLVRVQFFSPQGRCSQEYSDNYTTTNGVLSLSLTTAINDEAGKWLVRVCELSSGKSAETKFLLSNK